MIVLAGDIGGTNTRVALYKVSASSDIEIIEYARYINSQHESFISILDDFCVKFHVFSRSLTHATFGAAGPINNDSVKLTNLSWTLTRREIQAKLKIERVFLINDMTAIGLGLAALHDKDLHTLQIGKLQGKGVKAIIGAGTGLGVGFMTFCAGKYIVNQSEAGHIDFAPRDDLQVELLCYLKRKMNRVSLERVLSGSGLMNIYAFFMDKNNLDKQYLSIKTPQEIVKLALRQEVIAMQTLDVFVDIYGASSGNLALTMLPYGGLYIVGGIAPKILDEIKSGKFLTSFLAKGRMSYLMRDIPLHVVLNDDVGLNGAALYSF